MLNLAMVFCLESVLPGGSGSVAAGGDLVVLVPPQECRCEATPTYTPTNGQLTVSNQVVVQVVWVDSNPSPGTCNSDCQPVGACKWDPDPLAVNLRGPWAAATIEIRVTGMQSGQWFSYKQGDVVTFDPKMEEKCGGQGGKDSTFEIACRLPPSTAGDGDCIFKMQLFCGTCQTVGGGGN